MKNLVLLLLLGIFCMGIVGCGAPPIQAGVVPPFGWILTDYKAPLSANVQGITASGSKEGVAEVKQFIWIISTGDCTLKTATRNAGIKNITYADYEYFSVLGGVFSRFAVVVHGD